MNIVVTGAGGQLGRDVVDLAQQRGFDVLALDRAGLDLSRPFDLPPACDVVINCAAYTAVDRAETDVDTATRVNGEGPTLLATACKARGARLVHVSTDYVFDGDQAAEYGVDSRPNPLCVYGTTKLAGEVGVRGELPEATIVRTSWVFSARAGFVKTILRLAMERDTLEVVDDEVGRPTWTRHLAAACLALEGKPGTWHYAGSPPIDRWSFTQAILERAAGRLPIRAAQVERTTLAKLARPARRPPHAVLDVSASLAAGAAEGPWMDGVDSVIDELGSSL